MKKLIKLSVVSIAMFFITACSHHNSLLDEDKSKIAKNLFDASKIADKKLGIFKSAQGPRYAICMVHQNHDARCNKIYSLISDQLSKVNGNKVFPEDVSDPEFWAFIHSSYMKEQFYSFD